MCAEEKIQAVSGVVAGEAPGDEKAFRAYWRLNERNYRWNLTVNVFQGGFALFAMAIFMPETVLPTFMTTLTDSKFLIGLPWALSLFYWSFPAIFYGYYVQCRRQRMGPNLVLAVPVRITFTLMAVAAWMAPRWGPVWAIVVFFIGEALISATGGGAALAWQDMLGRVLPPSKRAWAFALRESFGQFSGLLGAALLGFYLKGRGHAAGDYAWPFAIGAIVYWISWALFAMNREPRWPGSVVTCTWREYYADTFKVLAVDRNFRTYVFMKCLMASTAVFNFSLFASYAIKEFKVPAALVAGGFSAISLVSRVVAAPVAGWTAGRFGYKIPLLAGLAMSAAVLTVGLSLEYLGAFAAVGFVLIYALNGMAGTTTWLADFNLMLEFGRVEDRPRYISVAAVLAAPVALTAAALSGWLVDLFGSYRWIMLFALIITLCVWAIVYRVFREPRSR